jgi:hypothetical protein
MVPDRHLIDVIKTHFERKSSAQLREIVQANDPERWSPEAVAAAAEVLQDRRAGRGQEPEVAEEERPPPPRPQDPYSIAFLALGMLSGLGGHLHVHVHPVDYAGSPDPDLPVPFGPKMAWLALDTTDTEAVSAALGLQEGRAGTWAEGIEAAHQSAVFITPPLADWTLAVGTALFPPDRVEAFVKPLLERLSRQFGEAQYFCTHQDAGLQVWARARRGRLVRGFGWLGVNSLTLWDEGAQTKEERDLGLPFSAGPSSPADQGQKPNVALPTEERLMQLACLWSIDPTGLDEQFKEPAMGLVGQLREAQR